MSALAGAHRINSHIVTTFGAWGAGVILLTVPANVKMEIEKFILRLQANAGGSAANWAVRLNSSTLTPLWQGVLGPSQNLIHDLTPPSPTGNVGWSPTTGSDAGLTEYTLKGLVLAAGSTIQLIQNGGSTVTNSGSAIISGRILEQK